MEAVSPVERMARKDIGFTETKLRLTKVLVGLGAPEYVICRGQRVEIKVVGEDRWRKATIRNVMMYGFVDVWYDDGGKEMIKIEEFEEMLYVKTIKRPR